MIIKSEPIITTVVIKKEVDGVEDSKLLLIPISNGVSELMELEVGDLLEVQIRKLEKA